MWNKAIKKTFIIVVMLIALLFGCLFINEGDRAYAFCDLEDTNGVTVHKNVKLSEHTNENYRKFAIAESYSSTFCSGYKSLNAEGTPLDFSAGGILLEAAAKGETSVVRLIGTARGETADSTPSTINGFSIIGQPIMENIYYSNTDNFDAIVPDYTTLEFTFGDLHSDAYIKISCVSSRYSTVYIKFSGMTADGTEVAESGSGQLANTSFFGPAGYVKDGSGNATSRNVPFLLNFDPANPQKYGVITNNTSTYTEKAVSIESDLPRIEEYYVDMAFVNKSQSHTAKFMAYELCKQNLSGAEITDTTAPTVSEVLVPENMVKGNAYAFTANAFDIVEDSITAKDAFTYEVMRKSDSFEVLPNGEGKFFFEQAGEYLLSVQATDSAGNSSARFESTITIEEEDELAPNIVVQGIYRDSYYIGEQIAIFDAVCEDNSNTVRLTTDVFMNSKKVDLENGGIATNQIGEYEVRYFAEDASGNISMQKYLFDVFDIQVPDSLEYTYSLERIYLPQLIIPSGWYYKTSLYAYTDTERSAPLTIVDGGYIFDVGAYTLVYSLISPSTEAVVEEFDVTITMHGDTEPPKIRILGEYQSTYKIGDTVEILPAIATDNSGKCDLEVKVFVNGKAVEMQENSFQIKKGGKYVVAYTATDASGNTTQVEKSFDVAKEGGLTWWQITLIVGSSVLVASAVTVFIILKCRKKRKSKEA